MVLPRWRANAAAQALWMLFTQFSSSTWMTCIHTHTHEEKQRNKNKRTSDQKYNETSAIWSDSSRSRQPTKLILYVSPYSLFLLLFIFFFVLFLLHFYYFMCYFFLIPILIVVAIFVANYCIVVNGI